jgi:CPA2 family monovalent cation:H+ antiporter-2
MADLLLIDSLLLLGAAVATVALLQRLHVPSILAYLLVGIILGPYTAGPVVNPQYVAAAAEFGIVFLLFTIGLNFSLPQIYALRHQMLVLGTGQVFFTTAAVGLGAWLLGVPGPAAFVIGAVFAQSSTTIISKQLQEQGEEDSRYGKLALALNVFQDVTAVPFLVVIPVLAHQGSPIAGPLAWALLKALLAFAAVVIAGKWLLRPLFHEIAARRSPELFTLTVLLVSLAAAWVTHELGLSMAFGAFLAGMILGETEFRHAVEATIRPFRDVLLGLFFITVGMLLDVPALPQIWQWALLAALALLTVKATVVAALVWVARADATTAWRTALALAVGGEFGFALLAVGVNSQTISSAPAQVALTAVLLSMFAGPFLIRYGRPLAMWLAGTRRLQRAAVPPSHLPPPGTLRNHVVVCGFGRIGQNVARFLAEEHVPYVALDLDPARVREARLAGEPVYYGDSGDRGIMQAVGVEHARLVVVSHDDVGAALKLLQHVRSAGSDVPVMVRTRDETHVQELRRAGATEVVPETLEAGMMIVSHALLLLDVPLSRVVRRMRSARTDRYRLLTEFFGGDEQPHPEEVAESADRPRKGGR